MTSSTFARPPTLLAPTEGLHVTHAVSLSFAASSYLLATAIFLVPLGRRADIYGRKLVFTLGVIAFCTLSIFASLARGSVRSDRARVRAPRSRTRGSAGVELLRRDGGVDDVPRGRGA